MRNFINEFKDFIMRGNVMDLAVAFIMGAAFQTVVKSVVDDLIMPLIGIITGSISFSSIVWHVGSADIKVGSFIGTLITFLLTSFAVFLILKAIRKAQSMTKKQAEEEEIAPETELVVLQEIRDALAAKKD
ncbi:large conductance mechanosensitive channel protein MscL [Weissella paramesenteroides]|jgi:large conductance mechanosensitive channel|uniref:Large-conductance mechanosensitive channel n=1 Tax=Weissella paramesenteroides ATCC 33313 TaxID=585506 RepID=C5RAB3_WEIPA|nr:large conductance mechanosensitive channel protein MscL [Weissella paramesenteroides]ATF40905.1 large conductance mechanosensitive channel protein MscL [Weissella paramesenteroides]EER74967.1 large conductance mechanosensitive channel protein [Weissella paramesenteroides ATCC 33313]KAA8439114.1 large conductance mechanosensitive channel protein MscL [Weissella paramesenteroides]KAA8440178.1 large conductance mechanosensitive channel protein MscL [Weissella paramesenteroides]KAA8443911.1 lar